MNPRDRKDFIDELSKLGLGGQGGGEVSGEHPVRIIELTEENLGTFSMPYEEYINNVVKFRINVSNTGTYLDDIPQNVFFEKIGSSIYHIDGPHYKTADVYLLNYNANSCQVQFTLYININADGIPVENVGVGAMSLNDTHFNEICLTTRNTSINLDIIRSIESSYSERALLITRKGNIIGTYYNGTFTAFVEGKIKQYNVNQDTGEITESLSIDISTLAGLEARIAALEGA